MHTPSRAGLRPAALGLAGLGLVTLAAARPAAATTPIFEVPFLDVQFIGNNFVGPERPAQYQTGAAAIGAAGDQWNQFAGGVGTGLPLEDTAGGATGLTLSYTTPAYSDGGSFNAYGGDIPRGSPFAGTPVAGLMGAYLYGGSDGGDGNGGTVTVGGLAPGSYTLYVYNAGASDGQDRAMTDTVGSESVNVGPNDGSSVLTLGVNDAVLHPVVGSDGLLDLAFTGRDNTEADLNGFQLVADSAPSGSGPFTPNASPAPEPSQAGTLALLGLGLGGLILRARRKAPAA